MKLLQFCVFVHLNIKSNFDFADFRGKMKSELEDEMIRVIRQAMHNLTPPSAKEQTIFSSHFYTNYDERKTE